MPLFWKGLLESCIISAGLAPLFVEEPPHCLLQGALMEMSITVPCPLDSGWNAYLRSGQFPLSSLMTMAGPGHGLVIQAEPIRVLPRDPADKSAFPVEEKV